MKLNCLSPRGKMIVYPLITMVACCFFALGYLMHQEKLGVSPLSMSQYSETKQVTDMAGRQVTIPAHPKVVVGLHALPDTVLGVLAPEMQRTVQPVPLKFIGILPEERQAQLKAMPVVNAFYSPTSTETIIAAGPSVVVTLTKDPQMDKRTEELGVPTVALSKDTFAEIATSWEVMGDITGRQEKAGAVASYIRTEVETLHNVAMANDYRPRAWVAQTMSNQTASNRTIMNEILHQAGAITYWDKNQLPPSASPTDESLAVPIEQMIEFDPEYIFCAHPDIAKALLEDNRLANVTAIKNGNVFTMYKYSRMDTMQSIPALRWVESIFYPHSFKTETNTEYTSRYYKEVFGLDVDPSNPLLREYN